MEPFHTIFRILHQKRVLRIFLFATLLNVLLPSGLSAQGGLSIYGMTSQINDYYPVSSEAAALFTKVPAEMDYCRGRMTFRIPLYEIKTPSFTLPITLTYTTGGIKVGAQTGAVGLGWHLEAEPMITREIRGLPDNYSLMRDSSYLQNNHSEAWARVGRGEVDIMNDVFCYRTLQSTGKFILNRTDNLAFHPNLLSHEHVKLSVVGGHVTSFFQNAINLVDTQGTLYVFGSTPNARETTSSPDYSAENTTWKVSRIQSANGEEMTFSYKENFLTEQHIGQYDYYAVEDNVNPLGANFPDVPSSPGYWKGVNGTAKFYYLPGNSSGITDSYYSTGTAYVNTRRLSEITFANGSVVFSYSDQTKTLQSIKVYDSDGALVKNIVFESTLRNYDRVLLNRILIKGSTNVTDQKYEFNYRLPSADDYSPYTKGVDLWGYYNGYGGNSDLIPVQDIPFRNDNGTIQKKRLGGATNRNPSLENTLFYALDKIVYPTGGFTAITYAQNKWLYESGNPTPAGGARIAALREVNADGVAIYREFKYRTGGTNWDAGYLRYPMAQWAFRKKMQKVYGLEGSTPIDFRTVKKDYTLYLGQNVYTDDNNVYYDIVDEHVGDIHTLYRYSQAMHYFNSAYLANESNALYYSDPVNEGDRIVDNGLSQLKNGNAIRIESTIHNSHNAYLTKMDRTVLIDDRTSPGSGNDLRMNEYYIDSYKERIYNLNITESNITSSSSADSLPGGKMEENITYGYGGSTVAGRKYNQLSEIERTTPEGDVYRTEYSYPYDTNGIPYEAMVSGNNVSSPVEERQYKNNVLKKTLRFLYRANTSVKSGYCLDKIMENTDDANTEFRDIETYDAYLACGRPLQITRNDGTKVSFLWGYGGQYVLAIAENLGIQEIKQHTGLDPEAVVKGTVNPDVVRTKMEALRATCSGSHIMTYDYFPLVGINRLGKPDGNNLYNVYDSSGRLIEEQDTDKKAVKSYEYHLINSNTGN